MSEIQLPPHWKVVTLGDVARIERGKFTHRPRNDPAFYGGNIPFIQTGDVTASNGYVKIYAQTLNEKGLSVSKIFQKGTIVITIAANIGYTAILEFDSAFPDSLIGITPNNKTIPVDAEYLNYYLWTQQLQMDRQAPRGTQKNINIQFLNPWHVVVPPLPEQKTIAHNLRTIQKAKETRQRELELERERKAALMQYLFTHGTRNEPRKQTEIGEIPETWEVVKLGDISKILSGGTPSRNKPEYWNGDIPWVKTGEIKYNIITDTEEKITKEGLKNSAAKIILRGTLLMAMYGQGVTRGKVAILGIDATLNQACAAILLQQNIFNDYVFYFLAWNYEKIRTLGYGANQTNLNSMIIKSITIPLPIFSEQKDIAITLKACDRKIQALEKEITLIDELFHAMLEQLMIGKISTQPLTETYV